ncbi:MAG: hypothetical protein R2824_17490 [Saprospiraceae bacterium]|nr:hypothetical protein [Lewinella sp.]
MFESIRYELSMMSWKNYAALFGIFLLCLILWIYLPSRKSNYRQRREKLEVQYREEIPGSLLNIRKLYRPAGQDGQIRFTGHELHFQYEVDGHIWQNQEFIPKNPDREINGILRQLNDGNTSIWVKYHTAQPQQSIVKLVE